MTTALRPAGGAVSQPGPVHSSAPATAAHPVVLRATPKQIGDLERSIPLLVSQVRRQLGSDRDGVRREIVLDLSAVPPMPVVAPLLLLVRLLGGLTGSGGKVEVIGVATALAAALTAFDLPDKVTLIDARGRRWPA